MDDENAGRKRRTFRWTKEARELVRIHLHAQRAQPREQDSGCEFRVLVTKLAKVSGNPSDACRRFARQAGVNGKRAYHQWPECAQQKLLDLIAVQPLPEVAIAMRRSPGSLRSMLRRLGANARMQPGDIISTGTPPGVGMGQRPPVYLRAGNRMRLGIEGLGEQNQRVVGESTSPATLESPSP